MLDEGLMVGHTALAHGRADADGASPDGAGLDLLAPDQRDQQWPKHENKGDIS